MVRISKIISILLCATVGFFEWLEFNKNYDPNKHP